MWVEVPTGPWLPPQHQGTGKLEVEGSGVQGHWLPSKLEASLGCRRCCLELCAHPGQGSDPIQTPRVGPWVWLPLPEPPAGHPWVPAPHSLPLCCLHRRCPSGHLRLRPLREGRGVGRRPPPGRRPQATAKHGAHLESQCGVRGGSRGALPHTAGQRMRRGR